MSRSVFKKTWLSPLVGVFFTAVGLSGVLMLFHAAPRFMHGMHEWIGLALVVTGVVHVILNWRVLLQYLKARSALISIGVGAALVALFLVLGLLKGDQHKGRGPRPPSSAMVQH